MPDRIVRDEILRSHRYVTLSSDTLRLLFIHLILSADSYGNAEATTTALGLIMGRAVDADTSSKWLQELWDCDLVRVYESGAKRYIHIPRYRQRLRYLTAKHPRPPQGIECSELKHLLSKVGLQSGDSQVRTLEVKRSEEKRRETNKAQAPFVLPDWIPAVQWQAWLESRSKARKAPTEFAKRLAVSKLDQLREQGHHPAAVLAQSAFNGWSGLFPIKEPQS